MRQMMKQKTDIKNATKELLNKYGITQIPIDIESLAAQAGAVLSYEPFKEELSGVLVKENDRTVIGVNSTHPKNRQRFTIAHELGHLFLQHQGEIFVDHVISRRDKKSSLAVDWQEIEANKFAAELLMPEDQLLEKAQFLQETNNEMTAIALLTQLAKDFQVSTQAMEIRLTNLGIFMPQ